MNPSDAMAFATVSLLAGCQLGQTLGRATVAGGREGVEHDPASKRTRGADVAQYQAVAAPGAHRC